MKQKGIPLPPGWLDIIPTVIIALALLYSLWLYPFLPNEIPTHFGFSGKPDAFSSKSFFSVQIIPILGLIITILMTLMNVYLIKRPSDPASVINLSERQKKMLGPEKMEEMRTFFVHAMQILILVTALLFVFLQLGSLNTALGKQSGLGWVPMIFVCLELLICFYMVYKSVVYTSYKPPTKKE